MRNWEQFVRGHLALPELTPEREARVVRELAAQLEDFYRDALARGLSDAEADAHACQQIRDWRGLASEVRSADQPNVKTYLEQLEDAATATPARRRRWMVMADLLQDVRYALRQLRAHPGFSAVAVLTLAFGIGANTAIFSMLYAVVLRPLPFPDSEHIIVLRENNRQNNNPANLVSPANFTDWKTRNSVFDHLGAYYYSSKILTGFEFPERVTGATVTEEFFPALGVSPQIGRIVSAEELARGERTVILSHRFWQSRFASDPSVVGKPLTLSGEVYVVTGVLPPRGGFPATADLWFPTTLDAKEQAARGRYLTGVGRLRDGITLGQAQAEMDTIARALETENPRFNKDFGISMWPLREAATGDTGKSLLLLFGTVGLVLLIACANVANLQLGRLAARRQELAVRQALGGTRFRLLRQLLTESLLLGLLGGLGGVGLAMAGIGVLPAMLPGSVRAMFEINLSLPVLAFTLAVSLLAGVLYGAIPALQSSRSDVQKALKEGGRSTTGNHRLRSALVVCEVAISLVLLTGAGLLARSLGQLSQVNPGFDSDGLLTAFVSLPGAIGGQANPKAPVQAAFFEQLLERVRAIPGVESAGAVNFLPVDTGAAGTMFVLRDRPAPPTGKEPAADIVAVAGDYFQTMRIPLVRGRLFDQRDTAEAPRAVIVNQAMVREFWPNDDPIGKRLTMAWDRNVDGEVVGVVGDVLQKGLRSTPRATLYWAEPQFTYGFMTVVARSKLENAKLAAAIRKEVNGLDAGLPVSFQTMEEVLAGSLAAPRITIQVLALFVVLAIVLAVVGLYGVVSFWVRQRTHEIGIRMALGASRRGIFQLVLRRGGILAVLGIVIGAGASVALTRVLESSLFGVTPTDPLTFAGAALLLAAVALLACYIPARRATRVDPLDALRYE